jgi:TonB family protein
MITPLWFSNALDWIAQVAVLVLAAGLLPHIFKIRQPRVLLTYWRALVGISLLLPLVQPWHRQFYLQVQFATVTLSKSETAKLVPNAHQVTYWQAHKPEFIAETFAVIILAGIAARFTILALGLLKLRQFRRASSPISNHTESLAVLDDMRVRVNTGGEFRISSDVDSPVTFGLAAPVILLPERFPALDTQYQSAIACHELLHVRRCDWAHHLSEEILRAALWFHPAIAWLITRIRLSREQVVDLEVVRLTDARKPYLEALLEFTNCRALAATVPAPPFLVERQLAERVALMLKEVRMSRTRLIASLAATAACLAVVATLAVWTFPLKAAARPAQSPPQGGIVGGVTGGPIDGVVQGVSGGVIDGKVPDGIIQGVPGGVVGGVPGGIRASVATHGVQGGVKGGVSNGPSAALPDSTDHLIVGRMVTDPIPGSPGHFLVHSVPPILVPGSHEQQEDAKTVRGTILTPILTVNAVYPTLARENHIEGTVILTLTVDAHGRVTDTELVSGPAQLVQAAKDAAARWEFPAPAKPPAITTASFNFSMSPGPPPLRPAPNQSFAFLQKIFTAPVTGTGENSPFYMGSVRTQIIYAPKPDYPPLAKQAKIGDADVDLDLILDTEGKVIAISYVKGPAMFVQAAMDKARTWIIKGTHDGAPVTFQLQVELQFKLF